MIEIIRYIAGGLIALFGAYVIISPILMLITNTNRKGGFSLIPLIGPAAFIGGVAVTPLPFSHWLWLAFLVDMNTLAIPAAATFWAKSLFSSSPSEDE